MQSTDLPLAPEQERIIEFLLRRKTALVWAGCGIGKTRATVEALDAHVRAGRIRRALVVAPKRVAVHVWPREVARWSGLPCYVWRAGKVPDTELVVTNYELLPKLAQAAPVEWFDTLIWDEVTRAKNPTSKRILAFLKHVAAAKVRWGLTGTPMPNHHFDLWGQLRVIDNGRRLDRAFWKFRQRWFDSDYMGYNWELKPGAEAEIMDALADVVLSVESEPWPIHEEDVEVPATAEMRRLSRELSKHLVAELEDGTEIESDSRGALFTRLRQLAGGAIYLDDGEVQRFSRAKLEQASALADRHDRSALLVTEYQHETEDAQAQGWHKLRDQDVDAWNAGEIPRAVINAASFGHGINLQDGGNVIIWHTLPPSWDLYHQTNSRLARRGQRDTVVCYRLTCPGMLDDYVASLLDTKELTQAAVVQAVREHHMGQK